MTTSAQQKRYDGIGAVTAQFLNEKNNYRIQVGVTTSQVVEAIESLRKLGRTERWGATLTRWQNMVRESDECTDMELFARHLHWAILQGNVYAGHAAD